MKRLNYLCLLGLLFVSAAHAITIDMVTVGNPGNAPDTEVMSDLTTGYGSVGYVYQIGKYEVTAGQYTAFLNAVAKADPNGLYNTAMGDPSGPPVYSFGANIQRSGSSPTYSYSVAADWANRPVNYVSFWDAARFANWLHNGQPTGAQGPGTTEGGAYHNVGNQTLFGRNTGAKFFIPTENEWYKAAYHDKTAGLAASYFDYPTGTNAVPGIDINETTNAGNNANYYISNYVIGNPYYRTVAGEFELSDSPYGTFDQVGNVDEWNEAVLFSSSRGERGGSFGGSGNLSASFRLYDDPTFELSNIGFRVASSIPEPSTLLLLCFGTLAMLWRRRAFVCASILAAVVSVSFTDRAKAITIDMVTIGNPGNAPDTRYIDSHHLSGVGAVAQSFNIGTTEVTNAQYVAMLQAVAATDPYGLYTESMSIDPHGGIVRSGASGSFTYSIKAPALSGAYTYDNKPVVWVSSGDAMRFANWLHNGQPSGAEDGTTTENGAYTLNGAITNSALAAVTRNSNPLWWLPSENEWYKAAYYNPGTSAYFDYPTHTSSKPDNNQPSSDTGNSANFYNGYYTTGNTNWSFTAAGAYALSGSPYGTFDQGGNAWEWNDTLFDGSSRGMRGGSWDNYFDTLRVSLWNSDNPSTEYLTYGFRVASNIPEPSTLLLLCSGSLTVLWRRRSAARDLRP